MNAEKATYPKCNFPLSSLSEIEEALNRQLESRAPFSMIRLGDAEGAVLGRLTSDDDVFWEWARRQLGAQIDSKHLNQLSDQLQASIDSADIIGIRDDIVDVDFPSSCFSLSKDQFLDRFRSEFRLRPVERNLGFSDAHRLAHGHKFLSEYRFPKAARFCSAWVHFYLSSSGALLRYLLREERPALVTGQEQLAIELRRSLRKEIDYYGVPIYYLRHQSGQSGSAHVLDDYVGAIERTTSMIDVKYPGQLFLVGGGAWSKSIYSRIKQLGGIALDVGAVCDAWIGIPSRPAVYKSMFNSATSAVPDCLLLSVQMEKAVDRG